MTLQNRVGPTGQIVATPHRGLFTGNRGIIHAPRTKTLTRRWSSKAWLVCLLEFQNRRRDVWSGRHWSELFFLDEATALAAGHRPCFHCRRDDANAFRAAWQEGNGVTNIRASEMDAVLHRERIEGRAKRLHPLPSAIDRLPDDVMIEAAGRAYLVTCGKPLFWSWAGYSAANEPLSGAKMLTPPSTVRALRAGYCPVLHPSAHS
ncbi:MAG: hypothetical protein K2W78_08425 [Xanthobacteraceae bacterium]|nr:hypothetical protein [Xanthobacteraceae bacterium]